MINNVLPQKVEKPALLPTAIAWLCSRNVRLLIAVPAFEQTPELVEKDRVGEDIVMLGALELAQTVDVVAIVHKVLTRAQTLARHHAIAVDVINA